VAAGGRGRQARRRTRSSRSASSRSDDCLPDTPDPDFRLCNLIPSFPNSVLEHLTLEDYGDAFDKACVLALDACSVFVPG
jgi:hypothetical protein